MQGVGRVAWDCFIDLGITVVYATLVGLLIVGVVASDDGVGSLLQSALYASLLPIAVVLLIAIDVALRIAADRRKSKRRLAEQSSARTRQMALGYSRL